MSAQHTPAPWIGRKSADGCGDIGIVADGGVIAEVFHMIRVANEGAFEEQQANAGLIIAAPVLLAALRELCRQAESSLDYRPEFRAALADGFSAINQAEQPCT